MSKFLQIVIQEKSLNKDYRAFCVCLDHGGLKWELRGYGSTPSLATTDVYSKYLDQDYWYMSGDCLGMMDDE